MGPINNERGSILLFTIIIVMVLTMAGMFSLNLTTFELETAGNCKRSKLDFQRAEMGINYALLNFQLIYTNSDGAGGILYRGGDCGILFDGSTGTDGNVSFGVDPLRDLPLTTGFVKFDYSLNPTALKPEKIAKVEIRSILLASTTISGLSAGGNSVPSMLHLGPAPEDYDKDKYYSRRYVITSTAYDTSGVLSGTRVQCGTDIAALKDTVSHYKNL